MFLGTVLFLAVVSQPVEKPRIVKIGEGEYRSCVKYYSKKYYICSVIKEKGGE